jgi:hypothetical protein
MRMTSSGWGVTAALAVGPYLLLKLAWLGGSTIGITGPAGTAEMTGSRFVVGNVITVGLMLVAVAFVVALTRPSARRVPGWLVLVLGAGATGLLVPILLGLPASSNSLRRVRARRPSCSERPGCCPSGSP